MIKYVTVVFLLFLFPFSVPFSSAMSVDNMQLLGKGEVYYLKFIKVYDAALYGESTARQVDILSSDVSKCLKLRYAVDLGKKDFIKAANVVLSRQFSQDTLDRVAEEIEMLHQGYRDVEKGDIYTLCYNEVDSQTTLSLNGRELVSIYSQNFAEIYFSIWLGASEPLDDNLRDNLLAEISNQ